MKIWGQRLYPVRWYTKNICSFTFPLVTLSFHFSLNKHNGNRSIPACYLSYPVLVLQIFQLGFQIRECWPYIRVILPAFQHYLMPRINKHLKWKKLFVHIKFVFKIPITIATESVKVCRVPLIHLQQLRSKLS